MSHLTPVTLSRRVSLCMAREVEIVQFESLPRWLCSRSDTVMSGGGGVGTCALRATQLRRGLWRCHLLNSRRDFVR